MFHIYRRFLDGMPFYLARYYWWAYLWPKAVWFFDHQSIINGILFGQYQKLMHATLACLQHAPLQRVLQLTCVYGSLTPNLIRYLHPVALHITDVAPVQLNLARRKCTNTSRLLTTRMNAESLGYRSDSFSTIVLFFLLHEMPHEARQNTISECMRILKFGGSLIMAEYAEIPAQHWLYRFTPARRLITRLEPFLKGFWHEDIQTLLNQTGAHLGKKADKAYEHHVFSGFYRVVEYRVIRA